MASSSPSSSAEKPWSSARRSSCSPTGSAAPALRGGGQPQRAIRAAGARSIAPAPACENGAPGCSPRLSRRRSSIAPASSSRSWCLCLARLSGRASNGRTKLSATVAGRPGSLNSSASRPRWLGGSCAGAAGALGGLRQAAEMRLDRGPHRGRMHVAGHHDHAALGRVPVAVERDEAARAGRCG